MDNSHEQIQGLERAAELIAKHLRGELSDHERMELDAWVGAADWHRDYFEQCSNDAHLGALMGDYHQAAGMEVALRAAIKLPMNRRVVWLRPVAAAAVLILLVVGAWLWYKKPVAAPAIATQQPLVIPPGRQGAVLTLADGKRVSLDSLPNGVVANQNGAQAAVVNGQLSYHPLTTATVAVSYNTISTPRGRQYQLVLPDGTRVWLNAASSITFPTVFNDAERKVTVAGEAYFEVARNASKPFRIAAGKANIEVLGTSLDIAAYGDERDVKTTLLEGSIKVLAAAAVNDKGLLLQPGQQAVLDDHVQLNNDVDLEQVMAWKNGLFYFRSTDVVTVMQQLSRWYDIDIKYEGKVPAVTVSGKMDKGLSLNEILEFLNKMDVRCKLLGRTVIVSNN